MKIDINLPTCFYDDRNKNDYVLQITEVLYHDDKICLARVKDLDDEYQDVLLFSLINGEVSNSDFSSWIATNNMELIERIKEGFKVT